MPGTGGKTGVAQAELYLILLEIDATANPNDPFFRITSIIMAQ
jgi:hypothetical protein